MKIIDILIIIVFLIVVSVVVYFSFIKDRGNPCKGCPYARSCNKGSCSKDK